MSAPLEGIKILDLSRLLPGPFCTMFLADLGAEVIKVEDPVQGDYIRWMPPYRAGQGGMYLALNRSKKSITLNLKHERGVEIFLELVRGADVVVDSFRPGVLDSLGAGYEKAASINPRIIYCSLTGYGKEGPYASRAGHDINYIGYTGVLSLNGRRGEKPVPPGAQIGDMAGAMGAAAGIMAALLEREKSGRGQFVDVSLAAGAFSMMPLVFAGIECGDSPPRAGETNLTGGFACYNTYETSDGKFVCLGAIEPKFFQKFIALVNRPDLELLHLGTGRDRDRLETELTSLFKTKTRSEWCDLLEGADICFGPVNFPEEALDDPHVRDWGMITSTPLKDGSFMRQVSLPFKLSRSPVVSPGAPPEIGQNTDEILSSIGISPEEIETLRNEGVLRK